MVQYFDALYLGNGALHGKSDLGFFNGNGYLIEIVYSPRNSAKLGQISDFSEVKVRNDFFTFIRDFSGVSETKEIIGLADL